MIWKQITRVYPFDKFPDESDSLFPRANVKYRWEFRVPLGDGTGMATEPLAAEDTWATIC